MAGVIVGKSFSIFSRRLRMDFSEMSWNFVHFVHSNCMIGPSSHFHLMMNHGQCHCMHLNLNFVHLMHCSKQLGLMLRCYCCSNLSIRCYLMFENCLDQMYFVELGCSSHLSAQMTLIQNLNWFVHSFVGTIHHCPTVSILQDYDNYKLSILCQNEVHRHTYIYEYQLVHSDRKPETVIKKKIIIRDMKYQY